MEGKLFWTLDDDMFAGRVPPDHVMVFGTFEQACGGSVSEGKGEWGRHSRVELGQKGSLRFGL